MALPSVAAASPRSPPPSWQPCIFDLTIDDVRFDIEDEYDKGYNDDVDDDDSIINTFLNGFPTPKVIQQHAEKIAENPMPTVQEELVHVPEIIPMPKPIQKARDSDDDDSICSAEFRHYLDGYDDSICSAECPHDLEEHDDYYDEDDNSRSCSCDHSTDEEFDEEVGEMMSKAQSDGIGQIIHKESVECDRVSDAVLDACLTSHPKCKVARETAAKDNMVTVAGKCEVEEEEEQEERSNDKKEKKKEKQRRKRQRQRERKRNKQEEEEEEEEEEKEDGETAKEMDRAA